MIHIEQAGNVAILRMEHGKVQAIDTELLEEAGARLNEVSHTTSTAMVITGTGKAFSAGVDLYRILNGGPEYLRGFLMALSSTLVKLFTYPIPVVAAINGHAIAGGCILAAACDYKIMAAGSGKMGVTELLVGVPFPVAALEIMRSTVPAAALQTLVYSGKLCDPDEARSIGLVDEVVAPENLLDRAMSVAGDYGRIPQISFRLTKQHIRRPAIERIERFAPMLDPHVAAAWNTTEIAEAIRAFVDASIRKR